MVEALLLDLERERGRQPGLDEATMAELRATLGLGRVRAEVRSR